MASSNVAVAGEHDVLTRNEQLTREFFKAWEREDEEAIISAFSDDAVYHNIPYKPVKGAETIRKVVKKFLNGGDMTFDLLKLVVAGDTVVTERVDGWTQKGERCSLPVMGILEYNDAGKITSWREYFDVKTFEAGHA